MSATLAGVLPGRLYVGCGTCPRFDALGVDCPACAGSRVLDAGLGEADLTSLMGVAQEAADVAAALRHFAARRAADAPGWSDYLGALAARLALAAEGGVA